MTDVPWIDWYQSLATPSWTPVPRTIGLIRRILYHGIIATFGCVFFQAGRGPGALLRLGLGRDGLAAFDHVDESVVAASSVRAGAAASRLATTS